MIQLRIALIMAALCSCALATTGLSVFATEGNSARVTASIDVLNNDAALNLLHHANTAEITAANAALSHLTNQQAISFAQTLLTDHQQSEQQVTQLADQKGLTLYAYQPSTVDIAVVANLSKLLGNDFDLAYLQTQLNDHERVLQDLRLLQDQINDADLQNLIDQTIPVIKKHVDLAKTAIDEFSTNGSVTTTNESDTAR